MINPTTYEGFGYSISVAAEDLTLQTGEALKKLHKEVIKNPDNITRAGSSFQKSVQMSLSEWNKKWKAWADDDLAAAYLRGVSHTDAEIDMLNLKKAMPRKEISNAAPLLGREGVLVSPEEIPVSVRAAFSGRGLTHHLTAFNMFRQAAYQELRNSALQVMRVSQDIYRNVAIETGSQFFREADVLTRRKFSHAMLDEYAKKGIQSVVYKNGRKVSIEAYSEMVGRTMSGHAAVQASLNRYEEYGYNLVRVSAHYITCPMCAPYEGAILSQDGGGGYPSVDEAISNGLFHPNCAHDISPYIPGVSPAQEMHVDPEVQKLIDEHGYSKAQDMTYKASQQQRHIERQIRDWKKKEVTSLGTADQARAHRKVLDWQKAQREHVANHPYLPRKYEREAVSGWYETIRAARTGGISPAEQIANRLYERAKSFEPEVTKIVSEVARNNNVNLSGLEYRLKTKESLKRKVFTEYRDNVGVTRYKIVEESIGDSLRYTYVINEEQYTEKVLKIIDDLEKNNIAVWENKLRNYWKSPTYRGINSNWTFKGKQKIEIQFHTPNSLNIKEGKSHKAYEKLRVETDPAKVDNYKKQIEEFWKEVKTPKGAEWITVRK